MSAYFTSLVTLPTIITSPGQYRTRGGAVVTVSHVSTRPDFRCHGSYANGVRDGWHKSGRLYAGALSQNDIVGQEQPEITGDIS